MWLIHLSFCRSSKLYKRLISDAGLFKHYSKRDQLDQWRTLQNLINCSFNLGLFFFSSNIKLAFQMYQRISQCCPTQMTSLLFQLYAPKKFYVGSYHVTRICNLSGSRCVRQRCIVSCHTVQYKIIYVTQGKTDLPCVTASIRTRLPYWRTRSWLLYINRRYYESKKCKLVSWIGRDPLHNHCCQ